MIRPLIPEYATYYEPFVGGGAVLFDCQPTRAVINDSNAELINVYQVIKESPEVLITRLARHKKNNSKDYFYSIRSLDRDKSVYRTLNPIERAARFIYLNKTCFNGLYRVNRIGEFNTPWGQYKNPQIVNQSGIHVLSEYLNSNDIDIRCGDYKNVIRYADAEDFVYFDPPYRPISSTSSFKEYTVVGFDDAAQEELKRQCDILHERGVKFLLSNSDCKFIQKLYKDYDIQSVSAKRCINSRADRRGAVSEVLIKNY